uniref:Uncharacterized protein n=1 Tax=Timema genevievae TaxID=629358 RepID=A0A7R9K558_TIMGE|nr:unnamed protein product [Timema genevievae]
MPSQEVLAVGVAAAIVILRPLDHGKHNTTTQTLSHLLWWLHGPTRYSHSRLDEERSSHFTLLQLGNEIHLVPRLDIRIKHQQLGNCLEYTGIIRRRFHDVDHAVLVVLNDSPCFLQQLFLEVRQSQGELGRKSWELKMEAEDRARWSSPDKRNGPVSRQNT